MGKGQYDLLFIWIPGISMLILGRLCRNWEKKYFDKETKWGWYETYRFRGGPRYIDVTFRFIKGYYVGMVLAVAMIYMYFFRPYIGR